MRIFYPLSVLFVLFACQPEVDVTDSTPSPAPESHGFDTLWSVQGHPERGWDISRMYEPQAHKGKITIISNGYLFDEMGTIGFIDGSNGELLQRNSLALSNPPSSEEPAMVYRMNDVALASTFHGWNAVDLNTGNPLWSADNIHPFFFRGDKNKVTSVDDEFFYFKEVMSSSSESTWSIESTPIRNYTPTEIFNSSDVPLIKKTRSWERGMLALSRPNGEASLVIYGNVAFRDSAFVCFIDIPTGQVQSLEFFKGVFSRHQQGIVHNGRLLLPLETEIRAYSLETLEYQWSRHITSSHHIEFIPVQDRLIIYNSGRANGAQGIWMELDDTDGSVHRITQSTRYYLGGDFYAVVDDKVYFASSTRKWGDWGWATLRLQIFNPNTFEFELNPHQQDSIGTIHGGMAYDPVHETLIVQRRATFEALILKD